MYGVGATAAGLLVSRILVVSAYSIYMYSAYSMCVNSLHRTVGTVCRVLLH